jgi:hypothetical protein
MNLPTAGTVDPWPEILHLLPQKVTYQGHPASGTPDQIKGFAKWMMGQMPAIVSDGDDEHKANCFLIWLRSETRYEAEEKTRMAQQAAVQQAPANPISDQTAPQVAQPPPPAPVAAPAAGEEAAGPGLVCPECGSQAKNLTGLKRHCTMTHKTDWSAIAQKHGLDINTGLRLGTAAPAPAPVAPAAPPPPPSAPAVPPMFGAPGQATQAPSFAAPAPPPMPGQTSIPFTQPAQVAPQQPMAPMFVGPGIAPMQMPAPPAQVAPSTIPMMGASPAPFVPPSFTSPPPPQTPGPIVAYNPNPAPAAPAPAPIASGAPSRETLAQMLGGPVDLFVVRLLDAAGVKLDGRVDVNQLALLAEKQAKAEQKVADLAQSAYGAGKQAAQRHFADLLTQHPNCYLLQNGYEPILPAGYLEILSSRVVRFHIATDSGRQITTIF